MDYTEFAARSVGEGVTNPRVAYLVAATNGALGADAVDWGKVRQAAPELFATPGQSMNAFIRAGAAAGGTLTQLSNDKGSKGNG